MSDTDVLFKFHYDGDFEIDIIRPSVQWRKLEDGIFIDGLNIHVTG